MFSLSIAKSGTETREDLFRRIFLVFFLISLGSFTGCSDATSSTPTPLLGNPDSFFSEGFVPLSVPKIDWVELGDPSVGKDLQYLLVLEEERSSADLATIEYWDMSPILAWNEKTRNWVAYYGLDPVVASRVYALISVAQYRSLNALNSLDVDRVERHPDQLNTSLNPITIGTDPYEVAVLLGATQPVLSYSFPDSVNEITAQVDEARRSLLITGNILPVDLQSAERFGKEIADGLIAERRDDGSADAGKPVDLPVGEGIWAPDPFRVRPEKPGWQAVDPWLMESADQFRPQPPPGFGTPEFDAAVAEVREAVNSNSPGDLEIVSKWADKRGTYTPPGHWNLIASNLVSEIGMPTKETSSLFTALNMALMDAGISCWDAKYHYLVVRPWQADPSIPALAGYPNHPSYPSGHSCFSWAAATVLSHYFPQRKVEISAMAEEASNSRLMGGLHYRMDMEAGKGIGEQVGRLAVEWAIRAVK